MGIDLICIQDIRREPSHQYKLFTVIGRYRNSSALSLFDYHTGDEGNKKRDCVTLVEHGLHAVTPRYSVKAFLSQHPAG